MALGCKPCRVALFLHFCRQARAGGMGAPAAGRWELLDLELEGGREEHLRLVAGFLSICMQLYYLYIPSTLFQFFVGSHLLYISMHIIFVHVFVCVCLCADPQISENPPAQLIRLHEIHGCRYISE